MSWKTPIARYVLDGTTLSRKILDSALTPLLRELKTAIVLDVGGASGVRYRRYVQHRHYWTIDVQGHNRPSVQADAHQLPVLSGSVDAVLSIQVLEHCRRPQLIFEEAHRVLKPGGRLILSTVLLYELHGSPHDYYRFTASALEDLASAFAAVQLIPIGNRFVAAYDLLIARSLPLNSLFGRLAYRLGARPAAACPTGFIMTARKAQA